MGLELDRAFLGHAQLAVVIVFELGVIHHEFVVEIHGDFVADHFDAERIPFAERFVGEDERVFAGRAGAVVPEAAGAFVSAEFEFGLFGVIPNLHLRHAAQINAAVGEGNGLVFHEQLEVAVVLFGRGVHSVAVVHQFVALDVPMRFAGLRVDFHHRAFLVGVGPFLDLRRARLGRHREELAMIGGRAAAPALEILAVEKRGEARRRVDFGQRAAGEEQRGGGGEQRTETGTGDSCFCHRLVGQIATGYLFPGQPLGRERGGFL